MIKTEEFFRLLADETRLRCLLLLEAKGELCVCDLTNALNMIQPKISRHLAILKKSNIVSDRRDGIWIYYHIQKTLPKWQRDIISSIQKQLHKIKPYSSDLATLNKPNYCSSC